MNPKKEPKKAKVGEANAAEDTSELRLKALSIYRWMVLMEKDHTSVLKKQFRISGKTLKHALEILQKDGLITVNMTKRFLVFNFKKVTILETPERDNVIKEFTPKRTLDDLKIVSETPVDVMVRMVSEFSPIGVKHLSKYLKIDPDIVLDIAKILDDKGLVNLQHKGANSTLSKVIRDVKQRKKEVQRQDEKEEDSYKLMVGEVSLDVVVKRHRGDYRYYLCIPEFNEATWAVMEDIFDKASPALDGEMKSFQDFERLRGGLTARIRELLDRFFPTTDEDTKGLMFNKLSNELHMGTLEYLLNDPHIEEIKAQSKSPVFIKHVKYRQEWIETNLLVSDSSLYKYTKAIARETRQQVDSSHPLMNAILHTGDRVNVSLPETTGGKIIIEIRVFSKSPWNIIRLVKRGTVSAEVLAFLWLAMQNKMNILISGETGSGKTSFLNSLCIFLPKNDHVISIEDTREIKLPSFFKNWSHMTTHAGDGREKIDMSQLIVNALRMDPSVIIIGEVRSKKDIESLMTSTAMGHPILSTIHTRDCSTTIKRFQDAGVPANDINNIHLNVILEAIRTKENPTQSKRRVKEIGEYYLSAGKTEPNRIYRLDMNTDEINMINQPLNYHQRIMDKINLTKTEIKNDLAKKKQVIDWLVNQGVEDIDIIGEIIQVYYYDPERVVKAAYENKAIEDVLNEK